MTRGFLTPRQAEMMQHVFDGKSNKQIARMCDLSPLTVKNHLQHIFRRLGARGRIDAIRMALSAGVLVVPYLKREPPPEPIPEPPPVTDWVMVGNIRMSFATRYAEVDGRPLKLSRRMLYLLAALVRRPGMAYSYEALLDYVFGKDAFVEERNVSVLVSRLRQELRSAGCNCFIRAEHNYGYKLVAP